MDKKKVIKSIVKGIFYSQLFAIAAGASEMPYYTGKIIPTPQKVTYYEDYIPITDKTGRAITAILIGEKASALEQKAAVELQEMIALLVGKEKSQIPILKEREGYKKYSTIISVGRLKTNKLNRKLCKKFKVKFPRSDQGYVIRMVKYRNKDVVIASGTSELGSYYAIQSLKQMLRKDTRQVLLRKTDIFDFPAFTNRIAMGDNWIAFAKYNKTYIGTGPLWKQWRDNPPKETIERINLLHRTAFEHGIQTILAISPLQASNWEYIGESKKIEISNDDEIDMLVTLYRKLGLKEGYNKEIWLLVDDNASLLTDETPYYIITKPRDREHFKSLGEAHTHLVKELYRKVKKDYPDAQLGIVPSYYWTPCGAHKVEGEKYLRIMAGGIPKDVDIIWTGPGYLSTSVSYNDFDVYTKLINGRKPLYWDNWPTPPQFLNLYNPNYFRGFEDSMTGIFSCFYSQDDILQRVGCLMFADYAWNPKEYNPEDSLKRAIATIAGPRAVRPLLKFRNLLYEIYDACNMLFQERTPGLVKTFSAQELQKNRLNKETFAACRLKMEEMEKVKKDLSKIGVKSKYVDEYFGKLLRSVKAIENISLPEALKVKRISGGILLSPNNFVGGDGYQVYSLDCPPRFAVWIYGKRSRVNTIQAMFTLQSSEIPTKGANTNLILEAQDDDKPGTTKVEILLNGQRLFVGENKCRELGWSTWKIPLNPGIFKTGINTLVIRNLEEAGKQASKWFMLTEAKITGLSITGKKKEE